MLNTPKWVYENDEYCRPVQHICSQSCYLTTTYSCGFCNWLGLRVSAWVCIYVRVLCVCICIHKCTLCAYPHLKICCSRGPPQKQILELKSSLCNNRFQDLRHIFTIFQKYQIYKLIACHLLVRYEL